MIELRGVSKYFPSNGVTALEKAEFTLRSGEIHALLGENGTGKSTLMHIAAGYLVPSSGTILVDEKKRHFSAPADALALGIGMVRQHPGFVRGFRVWEDCILGAERQSHRYCQPHGPSKSFFKHLWRDLFFDPGLSRKRVEELCSRWSFDLPLDRQSESLPVSQRQKAAVLALLLRDVKWFIFDEPTAVLTPEERESLFELFRRLRSKGRGIAFITHKLDEALAISDRVTVIRRGITEEPRNADELSLETLEKSIFSGDPDYVLKKKPSPYFSHREHKGTEDCSGEMPVLGIKDFSLEVPGLPHLRKVNLELRAGKILGIAGVRDSGLETLELALSGLLFHSGLRKSRCIIEGSITLNGLDVTGKGVRAFRDAGGAYLGADRLGGNLAPELPLRESLIIHAYRRAGRLIFLDMGYLDSWCGKIMARAGIARSVSDRASSFSGGMLQRILLAREFAEEASLLVFAEAGSGLDQVNRARLAEELRELVRHNTAVLLFSSDADELISLTDEIMVFRNGSLIARDISGDG